MKALAIDQFLLQELLNNLQVVFECFWQGASNAEPLICIYRVFGLK
jgi:hypothetical protein